jgi:hypothetical protein
LIRIYEITQSNQLLIELRGVKINHIKEYNYLAFLLTNAINNPPKDITVLNNILQSYIPSLNKFEEIYCNSLKI